ATAVALRFQAANRDAARRLAFMRSGYRNSSMPPEELPLRHVDVDITARYRRQRDGSFQIAVGDGDNQVAHLHGIDGDAVDFELDGVLTTAHVTSLGPQWYVSTVHGAITIDQLSRFPDGSADAVAGGQVAPMPGKILTIDVAVGDQVEPGQVLVLMEAMKMEHQITAPAAGEVTDVRVAVGDQVDNGEVLVVVDVPE
ncbi:MAG: hypothetical protein P8N02_13075, partial [Actinomycetota bacterium]|nr:hypothetical protein [Actinomycetota bacterium]